MLGAFTFESIGAENPYVCCEQQNIQEREDKYGGSFASISTM